MDLKPVRDRVFVVKKQKKEETSFGFEIITGQYGGDSGTIATVRGIGSDVTEVKEGDEVYVYWRRGHDIPLDGGEVGMIVHEEEIVAVLEQ